MKLNVAVVGIGYWGPNLVRNLTSLEGAQVSALCDLDLARAERVKERFCPQARVSNDHREVADDPKIDAVVIATPVNNHFELGSLFLSRGKHVFMEKPLAKTVDECTRLIELAHHHQKTLMVGHVFVYNAAVVKIKDYLRNGELGKLLYIYSQRLNLGRIQHDVSALWSFAPHDVSIVNYWLDEEPILVTARGFSYLKTGIEDVVFVTLNYPSGVGLNLHLTWLDPQKVRLMTLVGTKKMVVYDDVSVDSKIKLYDKGILALHEYMEAPPSFAEFQFQIRMGDVLIPRLSFSEPLQNECRHFLDCILDGKPPATDGLNGLGVVKVLQAAEESMKRGGAPIEL